MKVQPADLFSSFNLPDSIPYLSLLPSPSPGAESLHTAETSPSAPPAPPSVPFLHPLLHLSSEGLTCRPPTLNWSTASRVLDAASAAAYELVASSALSEVEREAHIDRLVAVHLRLDVEGLAGWTQRTAALQWRECGQAACEAELRRLVSGRLDALASVQRQRQRMAALHEGTAAALSRGFHFLLADDEEERRRQHARLSRQRGHAAAQHRLEANRLTEAARWQLAWTEAAAVQAAQRERETAERAARAAAEALKAEEEWNFARAKAKQGRLEVRVVRLELTDPSILPPNTRPFFACQAVTLPSTRSLDNPTPTTGLHFSPFVALEEVAEDGEGGEVGESRMALTAAMDWRCQLSLQSVATAQLLLSCQCADEAQAERWLRSKAKLEARREQRQRAEAERQSTSAAAKRPGKGKKGDKAAAVASPAAHRRRVSSAVAVTSPPSTSSSLPSTTSSSPFVPASKRQLASRVPAAAEPGKRKAKRRARKEWSRDMWSHPQRHRHITKTLELGRLQWRVKQVREAPGGEVQLQMELQGECWYAKRDKAERKRRKSTMEEGEAAADSSATQPGSPRPPPSPRSSGSASMGGLHPALSMTPSSLFPPPYQPHHSALQLVLMTDKERQSWLEEEERRERLRREREDKERAKWRRSVGFVWLELKLRPLDTHGVEIARPGTTEEEAQSEDEETDEDGEEEEEWSEDEGLDSEVEGEAVKAEPRVRPKAAMPAMRQVAARAKEWTRSTGVEAQAVRGVVFPLLDG